MSERSESKPTEKWQTIWFTEDEEVWFVNPVEVPDEEKTQFVEISALESLREELKRAKEALEYYDHKDNWYGYERARAAVQRIKKVLEDEK